RVLAELGKIGSNVNQIARSLNAKSGVHGEHLEDALTSISAMRTACMEALGRKP
ncbi:MAG: plasmid mobilization relaxosome protein MobC, partial [Robiginitomaculum sp.]|nr:plasmid mobilization relaxosome protein MobC [Robiginitomaculum sp.]